MERLRGEADFVIFDGPPLFIADVFPLAVQSDTVFVVARQGRTTPRMLPMSRTPVMPFAI